MILKVHNSGRNTSYREKHADEPRKEIETV